MSNQSTSITQNDGGRAFPLNVPGYGGSSGMSMRYYFAAKAMQAYISQGAGTYDEIAEWSYATADAMIKVGG